MGESVEPNKGDWDSLAYPETVQCAGQVGCYHTQTELRKFSRNDDTDISNLWRGWLIEVEEGDETLDTRDVEDGEMTELRSSLLPGTAPLSASQHCTVWELYCPSILGG